MSEGNVQCEKKTLNFLFSTNVYFKNLDSITQHGINNYLKYSHWLFVWKNSLWKFHIFSMDITPIFHCSKCDVCLRSKNFEKYEEILVYVCIQVNIIFFNDPLYIKQAKPEDSAWMNGIALKYMRSDQIFEMLSCSTVHN